MEKRPKLKIIKRKKIKENRRVKKKLRIKNALKAVRIGSFHSLSSGSCSPEYIPAIKNIKRNKAGGLKVLRKCFTFSQSEENAYWIRTISAFNCENFFSMDSYPLSI